MATTRAWVERVVIGLNLCPFAKAPQIKGQVRYVESRAADTDALLDDLIAELRRLADTPADAPADPTETTLLVHPHVLNDFGDYNDFLDVADAALQALGLVGELQIASFHPHYQFADSEPDDLGNATNRSPYPTLHLLREASIDRAVAAFPEPDAIFEANIQTLEQLGAAGWVAMQQQCREAAGLAHPHDKPHAQPHTDREPTAWPSPSRD